MCQPSKKVREFWGPSPGPTCCKALTGSIQSVTFALSVVYKAELTGSPGADVDQLQDLKLLIRLTS